MISSTTYDLEEILHGIDINIHDPAIEDSANPPLRAIGPSLNEERASIQQCLKICMEVSSHIDQAQAQYLVDVHRSPSSPANGTIMDKSDLARLITSETLTDCKRGIGFTKIEFQTRLKDANRRLTNALKTQEETDSSEGNHQNMRELLDSVKQCLSICDHAADQVSRERVNVFEDVSMADDGHQLILSTMGDLISAKRVTVGSGSIQWLGQISDASLQQLSKDQARDVSERGERSTVEPGIHFENRHGAGRKLKGK